MPPRILVEHARDFTGGLNLATPAYDLAENETPFCQDVDPQRRGGFSIRRGTKPFITTVIPMSAADTVYTFPVSGTRRPIVTQDGNTYYWDGAAWQNIAATHGASTGRVKYIEMDGALYQTQSPSKAVRKWTGAGAMTDLPAPVYNDNLAAPAGGRFVRGKTAAVHNGVAWVGNCFDSIDGLAHKSRIRWSHPGQPEDWRTNDWIDIDPDDDCGEIRAMVPFGDRLIVFKDKAVYAVHGYPPEGFSVTAISKQVGTPWNASVAVDEGRLYFWDVRIGMCEYNGKELVWHFDRLYPLIDEGKLLATSLWQVEMAVHNQRVWISVFHDLPPYDNKFVGLVFSPDVGKNGAWTLHTRTLDSMHVHRPTVGGEAHLIGGKGAYLYELDVEAYYEDQPSGASASTVLIPAMWQTRWFDAKNPAVKKRWKRPVFVVGADANQPFIIDVFDDYNPSIVKRTFQIFTDVNGTEGVWDVSDWDEVVWAAEVADRAIVLKGSPLGTGTAKALRLSNFTKGVDWRVHGVTMKWLPKRLRN